MPLFQCQILKAEIKQPVCIGIFNNDGLMGEFARRDADKFRQKLNEAEIKFAAVDREPPIMIFIEKKDMIMLEVFGINPTLVDSR